MDDQELKKLKLKCNKLIDEALRLEKEIKEKDRELESLQEQKKNLERTQTNNSIDPAYPLIVPAQAPMDVTSLSRDVTIEEMEDLQETQEFMELVPEKREYPGFVLPSIPPEKVFEMIRILSSQLDERPREEIIIRKLTFSAKLVEVFSDITGKLFKFLLLGIIMLLLSVGATILLNEQTRELLFDFVRNCIGI